jgi:hypothetical protein
LPPSSVNRLLVLASRLEPGPAELRETADLLAGGPDWDGLIAGAEREGVLPLLHRNLKRYASAVPGPVLNTLQAGYLRNLARNTRLYESLGPFLEAVRGRGLRAALTKGSRLALTLYPDIALRSFWDVDVIVHPADWPAVRAVLADLGYEEASGDARIFDPDKAALHWAYCPYFKKDGFFLEFHLTCLGLHVPCPPEEDVWAGVRPVAVGRTEAAVFSPEHELCHLCIHAQQHSYQRLFWLTDIAELAVRGGLDWDRAAVFCRRAGIRAPVYHALQLVNALWPGTLPWGLVAGFEPGLLTRAALRGLWPGSAVAGRSLTHAWPYYMPSLFSLWERKDIGGALRSLPGILFPPRAWMDQLLGGAGERRRSLFERYAERLVRPVITAAKRLVTKT